LIALYVDDLLVVGRNEFVMTEVKNALKSRYKMVDQGSLSWYLGMGVKYDIQKGSMSISQQTYVESVLERFGIAQDSKKVTPMKLPAPTVAQEPEEGSEEQRETARFDYRGAIGCLLYLFVCTRPDVSVAVSKLARHVSNPGFVHVQAVKRVLQYLAATKELALVYRRSGCKGSSMFGDEALVRVADRGYLQSDWSRLFDHVCRDATSAEGAASRRTWIQKSRDNQNCK
jgi:hypothetical protein